MGRSAQTSGWTCPCSWTTTFAREPDLDDTHRRIERTTVPDVCAVYRSAPERTQHGQRTVSTDELTGEIWLSMLVRKLLRRGNFTSVEDLPAQVLAFIAYFNRTMAKPFKWTYHGKPLHV